MIPIPGLSQAQWIVTGVAALAIAAAAATAGWKLRDLAADAHAAELQAQHATTVADAERRHRQDLEAAREREAAITAKAEEIVHAARQADADLRAARAAADAAGVELRDAAARYATRRCAAATPAAAAGGSPPAGATGDVLLDVLTRLDATAGILADHADRSRAAGLACERIYEVARQQLAK